MPYDTGYPWLVKDSVVFLDEYLEKNKNSTVLEFGAGGSTLWFAPRVKKIYSIEGSLNWSTKLRPQLPDNVELIHKKVPYYDLCKDFESESFDVILIDGRDRIKCFERCLRLVKPGGVLMLDNSERARYWLPITKMDQLRGSRILRRGGWPYDKNGGMEGWTTTTARGPDYTGTFDYDGWTTTWWIKDKA